MSNITVAITAQTADLQAKLALAQASLRQFSAETKSAANAIRDAGTGATAEMRAGLEQAAAGLAAARSEVSGFKGALAKLAESGGGVHASVSRLTLDIRELFDEFASGRTRQMTGTFARLLQQGLGLGPAMLAGVGGVAALAGGIGYLAYQSIKASEALSNLQGVAAFHNVALSNAQIADFNAQIEKLSGSSRDAAQEVLRTFLAMKDANGPLIQALIDQLGTYAEATGEKLPDAAKKLAEAFDGLSSKGEETLRFFGASKDEINAFDAAVQRGDAAGEYRIALTALSDATKRYADHSHDAVKEQQDVAAAMASLGPIAAATAGQVQQALARVSAADIAKSAKDIAAAVPATAAKVGPTGAPLDAVRAQIAQMEAAWTGGHADLLRQEIKSWQDRIAVGDLYGNQLVSAQRELARVQAQLAKETAEAAKQAQAQQERALKQRISLQHEAARQAQETARKDMEAAREIEAQWQRTVAGVRQSVTSANVEIAKLGTGGTGAGGDRLGALKQQLDAEMAAYKAAFQQAVPAGNFDQAIAAVAHFNTGLDDTQRLMLELGVSDDKALAGIVQNLEKARVAQARYADEVRQAQDRAAEESQRAWSRAMTGIMRPFDEMLHGVLIGTQTLGQAMQRMWSNVALSAIESLGKITLEFVAQSVVQMATGKAAAASQIMVDAKSAFAHVYNWVSSIPYVGWLMAPGAAAAAFAAVAAMDSFETGTPYVPYTGPALLHQGEMVIPAGPASAIRDGGIGSGDTYQITIQAIDTQTGAQFLKNNIATIVQSLSRAHRNGAGLGQKA